MAIKIPTLMYMITVLSLYVNIAVALYAVLAKPNLVKKIIALTILGHSVNTFAILVGYKLWRPGIILQPPVLTELEPSRRAIEEFVTRAVDPLPQALVLTAIVINLAVTLFLITLALHVYRHFGTVDMVKIGELKRGALREEVS
ncbi:MAG TPA: Na+/H+ antiporter subunit C [Ignisphaera sp.]|nr:Na+/H+ antiporter subunit C [Ignisphaera sp.]